MTKPPVHGRVRHSERDGVDWRGIGAIEGMAVGSTTVLGHDDNGPMIGLIAKRFASVPSRELVSVTQSHGN